jgi:hypothetical protein
LPIMFTGLMAYPCDYVVSPMPRAVRASRGLQSMVIVRQKMNISGSSRIAVFATRYGMSSFPGDALIQVEPKRS